MHSCLSGLIWISLDLDVVGLLLVCASFAHATNYYVDCNYGANGNPGTSPQQAWRTLLEVGISSFQPGDTINLLRDCIWNETLTPPSSGKQLRSAHQDRQLWEWPAAALDGIFADRSAVVDAGGRHERLVGERSVFGHQRPANVVQCGIRGFYCLTQAPSQLQYVRFGTVWGTAQGSQAALSQDRDFWYDSTNYILYVYSAEGNPASNSAYSSLVAPIVLSGASVLNLNNVSWLEIQHLQIDWFDATECRCRERATIFGWRTWPLTVKWKTARCHWDSMCNQRARRWTFISTTPMPI